MAATFVIEDGTGITNANAYCSLAEATQYHDNHGGPAAWTSATQATKENAVRQATQYLDLNYKWKYVKTTSTQALEWPKRYVQDWNGFAIAANVIPQQIKDACAHLALQVINGVVLIADLQDEGSIKRISNTVGPLSESIEYAGAERPEKSFVIADKLVRDFVVASEGMMELERA